MNITAVTFDPDFLEVTYMEEHDVSHAAMLAKTIRVRNDLVQEQVADILANLAEAVDEGLIAIRNPKKTL